MSILVILLVILSFALTIYATGPLFFSIICCTIIAVSVVMPEGLMLSPDFDSFAAFPLGVLS
jgi:hypothetical protein